MSPIRRTTKGLVPSCIWDWNLLNLENLRKVPVEKKNSILNKCLEQKAEFPMASHLFRGRVETQTIAVWPERVAGSGALTGFGSSMLPSQHQVGGQSIPSHGR